MKNLADLADLADMCPTMCTVHDALRKTTIMKQVDKIIQVTVRKPYSIAFTVFVRDLLGTVQTMSELRGITG